MRWREINGLKCNERDETDLMKRNVMKWIKNKCNQVKWK